MDIFDEKIEIILTCTKYILADNRRTWGESYVSNLDVPKGAYDSAQVAELIGIYILDTLDRIVNLEQVELYQDDGIIFIPDRNGPKTPKTQKNIIREFKLLGLRIEITSNLKMVDFFVIALNLYNSIFKPLIKSNFTPTT